MARFNISFADSTHEALVDMSVRLDRSVAEVIREALSIYGWLIREASNGTTFLVQRGSRSPSELVIPYLEQLQPVPATSRVQEARCAAARREARST